MWEIRLKIASFFVSNIEDAQYFLGRLRANGFDGFIWRCSK